jgi:apolipoprotein N-acyltransferase
VVLAAGTALAFAFPEADLSPIAWLAVAPLLIAGRGAGWRRGAGLGFVFGFAFFGTLLVWVSLVGWVAWAVLVVMEALFVAAFGALWGALSGQLSAPGRIALAAAAWMGAEFLRAAVPVVGFPWGQLAQSQHNLLWMLRLASVGGGLFLGCVLMIVNGCVAEIWSSVRTRRRTATVTAAVACALLLVGFVIPENRATGHPARVAIVQGNVPQTAPSFSKDVQILADHVQLTKELAGRADLVVWPESSVALDPDEKGVAKVIGEAAIAAGAPMIVGGNEPDPTGTKYLVESFEVSPEGVIVDRYQKTHLVPFGEYVPARGLLGWIPMLNQVPYDAIPGKTGKIFDVGGGRVAPVISFEGDFGSLVQQRIAAGGRLLVVATNTSTWGHSWASAQHVAFSQLRAAENGVWVVHAALSGISAFIDPSGRVVGDIGLYEQASLVHEVRFASSVSIYARTGGRIPETILLLAAAIVLADLRYRPRVASPDA